MQHKYNTMDKMMLKTATVIKVTANVVNYN